MNTDPEIDCNTAKGRNGVMLQLRRPVFERLSRPLAIHFCNRSKYVGAESAARHVMHLAASAQPVSSPSHFRVEGLHQLAVSQYGLRDKTAAEAKLRLAIDLGIARFGAQDARARN